MKDDYMFEFELGNFFLPDLMKLLEEKLKFIRSQNSTDDFSCGNGAFFSSTEDDSDFDFRFKVEEYTKSEPKKKRRRISFYLQ